MSDFLRVTKDEAFRLQKDYYKRYGTTMRGMMTEHGINPDDYLEFVHQIDHSPLEPNPALGAAIESLPGRKLILTNGTRKHADAVMKKLEIDHHFEDVFDIAAANLDPKPLPQVYDRFLHKHGVDPKRAAMFEDLARNLEVPHALGMTTVLVVPDGTREVFRENWENAGPRRALRRSRHRRSGGVHPGELPQRALRRALKRAPTKSRRRAIDQREEKPPAPGPA